MSRVLRESQPPHFCRVIAIDWSGDRKRSHRKIWIAEAHGDQIILLQRDIGYSKIAEYLIAEARNGPLVVGLDFAFSFPAWFVAKQGFDTAPSLWAAMHGGLAEQWLRDCEHPFYGKKGTCCPPGNA